MSVSAALATMEQQAIAWLRSLPEPDDAGWGNRPGGAPRTHRNGIAASVVKAELNAYADQLLREVALARHALQRGEASAALHHAALAGHSHGAATRLLIEASTRSAQTKRGGHSGRDPVSDDHLVSLFKGYRSKGHSRKAAIQLMRRQGGVHLSYDAVKRRLVKRGEWDL